MLNELRFSVNRAATLDGVPLDKTPPSAFGFTTITPDDPKGIGPPIITIGGSVNMGPSPQGPTTIHDMTYQVQDTFSWTRGQHALKFGADIRFIQNNFNYDFFNNGNLDFGSYYPNTGFPLADFVGGFFDNYYQWANAVYGIRARQLYFFAQDAWRVTKNLSFDYGLRYEYDSPQTDPHNEIMGWFPGAQSTIYPKAPPNFLYAKDPGTPNRGLIYPDYNNFSPRFGFAWNMLGNGKLVMRGGFGIFYDIEDGGLNLQFGGQPPFGYVANNDPYCFLPATVGCIEQVNGSYTRDPFQTANTGWSNPYPFAAGGHVGQFFTPKIPFAEVVTPHFRTPYAENFNYGFQFRPTKDTMVEAVYVGSLSRKAISGQNYNYPTLAGPQGLMAQYNYYVSQGDDPYYFVNPECSRPLAACNGVSEGYPYNFEGSQTGVGQIETSVSEGSSGANELQLTVDRRLNHGLQFRVAYTFGRTFDVTSGFRARSSTYTIPYDPAFDRGLADFDATQRFVLSPIWQLPFGKNGNAFERYAIGGWTVSTIASFQSGNPYTLFSINYSGELNNGGERPDVIGPVQTLNPRKQSTFSPSGDQLHGSCLTGTVTGHFVVNPTNLVCAPGPPVGMPVPNIPGEALVAGGVPLFTFGDMGRNVLRGPGINNWDISLMKNFQFTESRYLQFQTNFFNAFNHAQFFSPSFGSGSNGFSGLFGQTTTDTTASNSPYYRGPRIIQFALKIYF